MLAPPCLPHTEQASRAAEGNHIVFQCVGACNVQALLHLLPCMVPVHQHLACQTAHCCGIMMLYLVSCARLLGASCCRICSVLGCCHATLCIQGCALYGTYFQLRCTCDEAWRLVTHYDYSVCPAYWPQTCPVLLSRPKQQQHTQSYPCCVQCKIGSAMALTSNCPVKQHLPMLVFHFDVTQQLYAVVRLL